MKYLIWLVIALAIVVWLQRAKKSMTARAGSAGAERKSVGGFRRQRKQQPESMVQCAHCGIHFPASEAVTNLAGTEFCSEEHQRLGAR